MFPLGLLQLYESVNHGYFEARSLKFVTGAIPTHSSNGCGCPAMSCSSREACCRCLYLCWLGVRHAVSRTGSAKSESPVLFAGVGDRSPKPMETLCSPFLTLMLLVLVAAAAWRWMGRHSSRRADRYHTRGFPFSRTNRPLGMPREGARLLRCGGRVMSSAWIRYRAPAHTCNACAIKANSTDSDSRT